MGSYVATADVDAQIAGITITAGSEPVTTAEVDGYITLAEGFVNGQLAGIGFITPITGGVSVGVIKNIVLQGVLAQVLEAILGIGTEEEGSRVKRHWDLFERWLTTLIRSGGAALTDTPRVAGESATQSAVAIGAQDSSAPTMMTIPQFAAYRQAQYDDFLNRNPPLRTRDRYGRL